MCATRNIKTIKCWGNGFSGQLGYGGFLVGITNPTSVTGINNAKMITAGHSHTCALLVDKTLKCWGSSNYGQIGHGRTNYRNLIPESVENVDNAVYINAIHGPYLCYFRGPNCTSVGALTM